MLHHPQADGNGSRLLPLRALVSHVSPYPVNDSSAKLCRETGRRPTRSYRPLDGCGQPGRRPVAGKKQVAPGRRRWRPAAKLRRGGGEGRALLLDDAPRRQGLVAELVGPRDIPPQQRGERLGRLVDQAVGRAHPYREHAGLAEHPLRGTAYETDEERLPAGNRETVMGIDDGAELAGNADV